MSFYFFQISGLIFLVIAGCIFLWNFGITRLKRYDSPILGAVEVWQKFNNEKVLTINKYTHGISANRRSIKTSYWYDIAQKALDHIGRNKSGEVLFLGLGANTSSSIIGRENPTIHQTFIEIDSSIIQAAETYFDLKKLPNYTLIQGDAYKLIDQHKDFLKKFDVIVIDIFTGNPPYVSTKSDKPNFIQKLMKWTKPGGLLIFNRPANTDQAVIDSNALTKYLKTILKNVQVTYINDPRKYQNNIVTGIVKTA